MKLGLCAFSVFFVFIGVPFGSKSLIGTLNLKQGSVLAYPEDRIIVFNG
jgi:hypothetical protein